jgi:predicted dehydrogenase
MTVKISNPPVRIAIIGAGAVSDYHHVPGIRIDSRAELVALCDSSADLLKQRQTDWGVDRITTNYQEICNDDSVDAVIIATPNFTHKPMAVAAARAGKHVMCEKPLGLNANEVREMYRAAMDSQVVHMTAFTYRFAPSMRYMKHLAATGELGELRHFRSQRFWDWPETSWGWRQYKDKAGAGDLFDMTIHRIDLAGDLMGRIARICGAVAQFAPRDRTPGGESCPASEVDDWSSLIGQFDSGAVGVWEGTTLAKGYGMDGFGHEWAEINGSEASAVYRLRYPNTLMVGRTGDDLKEVEVPAEFLKPAGSPRTLSDGDPATLFRYDLVWEFVSAIVERRQAIPNFYDGLVAQMVADAVLESFDKKRWIEIENEPR